MANLIEDITVAVATTQVDIDLTSTPIEKGELYELEMTLATSGSGGTSVISLYANDNITATNYYKQNLQAGSASVTGLRSNNTAFMVGKNTSGEKTKLYVKLTNDGTIVFITNNIRDYNLPTSIILANYAMTSTFTATNITKLNIVSDVSNGIGVNSRIQLRKVATKVDEVIVGTATTQIDFTVDIGKGNEYLLVSDIFNNSGTNSIIQLFVNDDTTPTNYDAQNLFATSTSIGGSRNQNSRINFAYNGLYSLGVTNIKLANSGYFNSQSNSIAQYGTSTILLFKDVSSKNATITSITKLNVKSDVTNALGVGTRIELYKLV